MTGASPHRQPTTPLWATGLGVVAVLFGTLFTATQGNELLVQAIIAPGTAAAQNVPVECRKDEAEEEGVSVAECELMVANVRIMLASRSGWFRSFQMGLALFGVLVAFGSILVGVALVDARPWAPTAAVAIFGALLVIDAAGFGTALYTGPLLRATYLPNSLLWAAIHLCLAAGAVVGRQAGLARNGDAALPA